MTKQQQLEDNARHIEDSDVQNDTTAGLLIYLGDDDVAVKTSVHILHVALHSDLQSTPTNLFLLRPHHHTLALCRQLC